MSALASKVAREPDRVALTMKRERDLGKYETPLCRSVSSSDNVNARNYFCNGRKDQGLSLT